MRVPWYLMAKGKGGGYKTASGPIVSVSDALAAPLRSLVANIEPVQSGSGDPSPDNVRPISGWSEVNVWRTGKNLSSLNVYANNPTFFWGGDYIELKAILNTLPAGTYMLSNKYKIVTLPVSGTVIHGKFLIRDVDGNNMSSYSIVIDNSPTVGKVYEEVTTFTITDALVGKVERCYYYCDSSDHSATPASNRGTYNLYDIQLELSSTATPYTPYTGNQFTLQLGQTVYGGTLDVTSGVLRVDRAMVDLGTLEYSSGFSGFYTLGIKDDIKVPTTVAQSGLKSDIFIVGNTSNADNMYIQITGAYVGWVVFLPSATYATAADFKTAMNGHQLVYTLATPITIPLTATQISLLKGQNTLWADTGDVTVEYLSAGGADPDLMKLAVAFMGRK